MKHCVLFFFFSICSISIYCQTGSTALRVYQIFQSKCVNCHNNDNPRGGLNLEGMGSSTENKAIAVYNNLVGVSPKNATAASKGYQLVHPGRVDKSFLFKKINEGLDRGMELEPGEMDGMPLSGTLSNVEKELVRQWILFGAPKQTSVISEGILVDYYENGKARASFPDGPPPAPAASEGFQIKMGPFFIDPSGEDEYYTKYKLDNMEEIEVNRIDIQMSNFSHHFIIYDYSEDPETVPDGFRRDQDHTQDVSFVATVQSSQDLALPRNTAFKWGKNHVLDLNSHTINYVSDNIYQNEVYINVYTQPNGTAVQEMQTRLIPYPFINIPNNGNEITHSAKVQFLADAYIWNIGGHTHRYGTSYKIWMNDNVGNKAELIYDASCPRGIPGCVAPFYDYQHIPNRTFDEFLHVDFRDGVTHEAKWVNDGPKSVFWGPTSEDEMMLFGMIFVTDTTGLGLTNMTTSTTDLNQLEGIKVMPNPMHQFSNIMLPDGIGAVNFSLVDMLGRKHRALQNFKNNFIRIDRGELPKGMYLFTLEAESGRSYTGKLLIE